MGGCFVPRCKSGNQGSQANKRFHIFRAPEKSAEEWKRILRRLRSDTAFDPLNKGHRLCHLHFKEEDLIKGNWFQVKGEKVFIELKNWKLKEDAVPTLFPSIPKRLHPSHSKPRRILKRPILADVTNVPDRFPKKYPKASNQSLPSASGTDYQVEDDLETICDETEDLKWWDIPMDLPANCSMDSTSCSDRIFFIKLNISKQYPEIQYSLTVNKISGEVVCRVGEHDATDIIKEAWSGDFIIKTEDASLLLSKLSLLKPCIGISGFNGVQNVPGGVLTGSIWHSLNCAKVGNYDLCTSCKMLHPLLQSRYHRQQRKLSVKPKLPMPKIRPAAYYRFQLKRAQQKQKSLAEELKTTKRQLRDFDVTKLESAFANLPSSIPPIMFAGIKQAVQNAQRAPKGRRYEANWLLECLLLKIKSPAAYKHLREAKILPLPHPNTIRKLISGLPNTFGFNEFSLNAIKKKFQNKSRRDRQGVLMFDEVQLREGVEFDKKLLKFTGFIDFAEYTEDFVTDADSTKYANHALVLMYRPFNSNWVQPIAAFATRNAAKGNVLEKLLLSAVMKLESVGAEVLSVVCDGAKPNKSLWSRLGISGYGKDVQNKIPHPFDESRFLYFVSDTPHLFKCIRNHLHKYRNVEFQGKPVSFDFYDKLLELDTRSGGLRKCPKLSKSHTDPNNFEKMKVSLATQLLSRSVSTGLKFYRHLKYSDMEGSSSTERFTLIMNDIFDCLNARLPQESLRKNCKKYKMLLEFSEMLTQEMDYVGGKSSRIGEMGFASNETIAGLRVTVQSTLEIVSYLTSELNYSYVLTAKMNQDCLEKFFGLIRAAGGREDHPTISNFLQLYRLLNLYTPTKQLLRANITDDESFTVLCQFEQSLRSSAKLGRAQHEKNKSELHNALLNRLIGMGNQGRMLRSHLKKLSENYGDKAEQNLIYYLAGFLCHKAEKFIACTDCVKSISSDEPVKSEYSQLVNIINKGRSLCYPSDSFFKIICNGVEASLNPLLKNVNSYGNIIMTCIENMSNVDISAIGCKVDGHKEEILVRLIPYYITLRLHFYARSVKSALGNGKATKSKRKEAKLVSS